MNLKQILEDLWDDNRVRCPRHITRWISELDAEEPIPRGLEQVHNTSNIDLFYAPGRRVDLG